MKTDPQFTMTAPARASGTGPRVLAVALSDLALDQMPRHVLAPGANVAQSALAELTRAAVSGDRAPELILAPLTARGFDAMDLLARLSTLGFTGRVLVLTPHMPDVALVRADVVAQAPDMNVDVMALDGSSALHLA